MGMPSPARTSPRPWLAALGLAAGTALAQEFQDLAAIQRAGEAFVEAQTRNLPGRVETTVAPPEPRTRLARCERLQAFLAPGVKLWGNANVGVRCVQPEAWTVYLQVTVKVFADVVVLARPVPRGHALSAEDVRLQTLDLTQQPAGVFTDASQVLGRLVTGAFPAGAALRADQVRAPLAVNYGEAVRIVFQGDGFRVSSEGRALGNAAIGESVQVRAASGRVLRGTVREPGVVEVH
jgi:flagella basal body P-ring formation protein FlgA